MAYTTLYFCACLLCSCRATAQSNSSGATRIDELVQFASAPEREEWWAAAKQLGALASRDAALREEIWRRARVNTLGMKFVRVEPGNFTMGPDVHRIFNIQIAHAVRITESFFIATTEVTNEQFSEIFPAHRADTTYSPDAGSPVVHITWKQAVAFCKVLSEREGTTYRLPTEAEWEYACRAGTRTWYSFGAHWGQMPEYGWCMDDHTKAGLVASLRPNPWGIYDMHGNVFEWVGDWFSNDYYASCAKEGIVEDPQGPEAGRSHVLRSCGWQVDNAPACTCTARFPLPVLDKKPFTPGPGMRNTIGFRIVREASTNDPR